jgi:hypothetical protein
MPRFHIIAIAIAATVATCAAVLSCGPGEPCQKQDDCPPLKICMGCNGGSGGVRCCQFDYVTDAGLDAASPDGGPDGG